MPSREQWFNMALSHLGQDPVADLNFDDLAANRTGVRRMMAFMDQALDLLCEDHDWLDMQVPINVTPLSIGGFTTWPNIYLLPNNFIRMSKVIGCAGWQTSLHYDQGNTPRRVLLARGVVSEAFAIVRPPWDMLSPSLGLAATFKLAWLACVAITGKADLRPHLEDAYLGAYRDAGRAEAFNHSSDEPEMERFQDYRRQAW